MPRHLPGPARLGLTAVKLGVIGGLVAAGVWTPPDATSGSRVDAARVDAGRADAAPSAVLERMLIRHRCSVQGFGTDQQPRSAVIRSAAGSLRFVDFDTGWQVYTRHGAATLVAVCLDAPG